ncbi:hypothetical protein KI809_08110 [Geobacter pelophilus]|uniref:Uncharacterized protein n=1 Tax=Geoanaerobacter pelophilus TaxID=60036 RepID=A0AAW4KZQ0_9BACT|nr:hypothetical protein [Geoanaerobacter pelophilus]MBT0664264.1 hypothetical protein [Geoanaerobacter pelophilus]
MNKTTALYAVTVLAVVAFSGIAYARGGNPGGQGHGSANHQGQMSNPVCNTTGMSQQSGTQIRPMDGTGKRYGQTRGKGMTPAAPQAAVTVSVN